jgi:putative membrane protein
MTIRTRFITLVAAGLLVALPASPWAAEKHHAAGTKTSSSIEFMKKAAAGGMAEVQLGNLAQERASSEEVKSFAKRMVDDHTKVNDDLEQVAQKKNVTLPTEVDAKDKALYDRLSKLSGTEFDRAYMDAMLADHRADVAEFERETKSTDADVRDFASRTLPTLQDHLASAQHVDRALASSKGSNANTSTAGTGQHRATAP